MILEKVKFTIKRYRLIEKDDKIVVGVSGGPDSVALLYLLNTLKKKLRLRLHIAHLDHRLRSGSSKDRVFVEALAHRLNIPITCAQINVRGLAKKGSLEETARNVRLGFFFKVANRIKAKKICLGHNLDDQAETVLIRILRGTGLYGLSGIFPKRDISGYTIIRPLIEVKRFQIEAFLKRKKIKPCIDSSNLEDIYFRNKIRNRLLPLLEKEYNQNIKEVLAGLAQSAGSDYDYLNQLVKRRFAAMKFKLSLSRLCKLHPAIWRLVLRYSYANLKGDLRRLTFKHIKEIEDLLFNRPVNSIVDLPKGIAVLKKKTHLYFYRKIITL